MQRLTLDMTAIRDALDEGRENHREAVQLLERAEQGEIELGVPPQGRLADLHGQFDGELAGQIAALLSRPGIVGLPQIARLSDVTFPGDNLFPGAYVEGLPEAWSTIAEDWNGPGRCPGDSDRWYVEAHILDGRDVLISDDRGLRSMCDRLRNEYGFPVHAESVRSFT